MTAQYASHILKGYNSGFRAAFIVNAGLLAAAATAVSVLMIRHKELTRADESQLRAQAEKERQERPAKQDVEMADLQDVVGVPESEIDGKK